MTCLMLYLVKIKYSRYSNNQVRIYTDGEEDDTVPETTSLNTNSGYPLSIGAFSTLDAGYFDGAIDDVRIYNRAFSDDEVKSLYVE